MKDIIETLAIFGFSVNGVSQATIAIVLVLQLNALGLIRRGLQNLRERQVRLISRLSADDAKVLDGEDVAYILNEGAEENGTRILGGLKYIF